MNKTSNDHNCHGFGLSNKTQAVYTASFLMVELKRCVCVRRNDVILRKKRNSCLKTEGIPLNENSKKMSNLSTFSESPLKYLSNDKITIQIGCMIKRIHDFIKVIPFWHIALRAMLFLFSELEPSQSFC